MRILIADDHPVVRSGLRTILGTREHWEICAEASTGEEAVAFARQFRPDVALIDLNMPGIGGFSAAAQIKRTLPGIELIVLTCHYSKPLLYEIMRLGVLGFVLKSDAEHDVVAAVEAVHRREPYISRHLDALLPNSPRTTPLELVLSGSHSLTAAERAEVRSIADQIRDLL
jgi:DNA-binding NarL/FixJ family response regulator